MPCPFAHGGQYTISGAQIVHKASLVASAGFFPHAKQNALHCFRINAEGVRCSTGIDTPSLNAQPLMQSPSLLLEYSMAEIGVAVRLYTILSPWNRAKTPGPIHHVEHNALPRRTLLAGSQF
jgi:hypothetical protein